MPDFDSGDFIGTIIKSGIRTPLYSFLEYILHPTHDCLIIVNSDKLMLSTTNQKMSFAVTFLPSLFLSGSAISSRLVRRFGTRTLGITVGILVSSPTISYSL